MSCPEIPVDRRVFYALMFFTGARPGEVIPLRWSSLLARADLDGLQFAKAWTKTEATKVVPVHHELVAVLKMWREEGWQERFGRAPDDNDLIVPMPLDPGRGRRVGGSDVMWSADTFRKRAKGDDKAKTIAAVSVTSGSLGCRRAGRFTTLGRR